jgi:hypothetical protein
MESLPKAIEVTAPFLYSTYPALAYDGGAGHCDGWVLCVCRGPGVARPSAPGFFLDF